MSEKRAPYTTAGKSAVTLEQMAVAPNGTEPARRFRLLHPALVKMEQDNAELVKRNLVRAEEIAALQARVALLLEQRRTAQYRLGDCLNFLHDLRAIIERSGEANITKKLDRSIELFLGNAQASSLELFQEGQTQ